MLSLLAIAVRVALLISGAAVLGLSISLSKRQQVGNVPPETGFSVFASAFGVSASLAGLASLWIEAIRQGTVLALDGVVMAAYLAAAVALSARLRSVLSCNSLDQAAMLSRARNRVVNGGCFTWDGSEWQMQEGCQWSFDGYDPSITSCRMAVSDYTFEFLAVVFCLAMLLLDYLLLHRGGSSGSPRVRGNPSAPSSVYNQ